MTSMWRRAMLYLGLGPDEEYEDYEANEERAAVGAPTEASSTRAQARGTAREVPGQPVVRPLPNSGADSPVRAARPTAAVVRPVAASLNAKPHVVAPGSFNDAQEVADRFKASQPVIVNLQGVERDLARRIIDFTSGVCYGLGGHMEKVAGQVYLLTPSNVEVSAEERRRLEERGYDA